MSSTNRGYERHKTDYYVTPKQPIRDFLDEFFIQYPSLKNLSCWFDPCAGGDDENEMSYPSVLKEYGIDCETMDIRRDSKARIIGDYLDYKLKFKPSIIITNPPFYLAKEIIEKALDDVMENGIVIMLLRLNFFGSKERYNFFMNNMPIATFVHKRRMSFTKDKKTDSIEYMHAVFQQGHNPEFTKLKII